VWFKGGGITGVSSSTFDGDISNSAIGITRLWAANSNRQCFNDLNMQIGTGRG
jgi:hypothetical protein